MATGKGKKSAKAKKDGSPRRFGWQDQQEAESKAQFTGRLAKLGWNVMQPEKDLGEDYLVQIYDNGVSSGLSFYVQLKSIKDAEKRKGKRTPEELRYSIEVKDIEHWEVQSPPVVLFIWDVDKQAGYWETIPRIVEVLEKKGKEWRGKASATVRVPVENGTDEEGMRRLRRGIADDSLAQTNLRGDMTFSMHFPTTPDGLMALTAVNRAFDLGEEVTLDGTGVPEIEEPPLYRRLYGNQIRPRATSMTITPTADGQMIPVRVEVRSLHKCVSMPYIELRATKQGRKHQVFTNEHQNRPVVFILFGNNEGGGGLTVRWIRWGHTIQEARETVEFYRAMQQPGCHFRLYDTQNGKLLCDLPAPRQEFDTLDAMSEALEKLTFLEPYISKFGVIQVDGGIGRDDHIAIEILYQAFKYGKVRLRKRLSLVVAPNADEYSTAGAHIYQIESPNMNIQVLGINVLLGGIVTIIHDASLFETAMRSAIAQARSSANPIQLQLENVDVTTKFLDWPPPRDRLQDLAATQSGYFTLTQAFESGFTSAEQLQIHERVERCADGVYRFILHPASDHEDLVVTWLQTEKQGVFSHDTALALHELSDILPVRQHITVPPGWKPIEGMGLSANTVVHEGTVTDPEKSWMGPVPFTKPLRTLIDCIDDVLPPELLDQALSDAYGRGMLSPVELHSLQARKAKSA